jgi:hypothetical protein
MQYYNITIHTFPTLCKNKHGIYSPGSIFNSILQIFVLHFQLGKQTENNNFRKFKV